MSISLVGAPSVASYVASDTSISITLPTLNADDLILIGVFGRSTLTGPSGYSASSQTATHDASQREVVYYKTAVSGDSGATVTVNQASAGRMAITYAVYRSTLGAFTFADEAVSTGTAQPITAGTVTAASSYVAFGIAGNTYADININVAEPEFGASTDAAWTQHNTTGAGTNTNRLGYGGAILSSGTSPRLDWTMQNTITCSWGLVTVAFTEPNGTVDVGTASETDTANAITASGPVTVSVGTASESDAANAISASGATTTASADDFDSAIGSASVTGADTSTPTLTITPDDQPDVTGWLNTYNRFSGVNGKTPEVVIDCTNSRYGGIPNPANWGPVWRYTDDATVPADGRPRAWSKFDNSSAAGDVLTLSNSTAFTSDDIEIAFKPRWRYLDTQRAFDYVAGTAYAVELDSSVAASSLPTHVHAQFTHTGTIENTAPQIAINMYCIGVDDTSVQPDGGEDKLNVILIPGQHSSEDQGNDACWETIFFYTDGTGTVADRFRKECRLFVYDANPQGRYYGAERHTDETASDEDPNREWISGGGASEQIDAVIGAIDADVDRTDILLDWHGAYFLNGNGNANELGIYETYTTEGQWRTRINTLLTGLTCADIGNAPADSAQDYGNDVLGAQLSSTPEFPIALPNYPDPQATYEPIVSDYIEAIQQMVDAGELRTTELVSAGNATETDTANAITASTGSPTAVSVGTASETDTANTIAPQQDVVASVGTASETDTANAITPAQDVEVAVGAASESDTANEITASVAGSSVDVGVGEETDNANAITAGSNGIIRPGQPTKQRARARVRGSAPGKSSVKIRGIL